MPRYVCYTFGIDRSIADSLQAPVGVFIHPSAYFIYDTDMHINMNSKDWSFQDEFCGFRLKFPSLNKESFWDHNSGVVEENIKKIRILVCGNAGVGKTSLLNKVLGESNLVSTRLVCLLQAT
jgi:hypothetical protein